MLAQGHDLGGGLLGRLALDKVQDCIFEGVVHNTVQPLAQQVGAALPIAEFGGGILPDFAQQELFRAYPLDGSTDLFNKGVRQLVGHVQPEASRTPAQPGIDNAALAGDELHKGGGLLVDLRQGLEPPPAAVSA